MQAGKACHAHSGARVVGRDVDRGWVGVASDLIFLSFHFFFFQSFCTSIFRSFFFLLLFFFLDLFAQFCLVIAIVNLGAPKLVTFSPPSGPAARKDGGERECCNTTITFTKNNIVAIMIRNITLNNRTLLLGGDTREQIDNAVSLIGSRVAFFFRNFFTFLARSRT